MFNKMFWVLVWFYDAVLYSIGAYNDFKNRRVVRGIISFCIVVLSVISLTVQFIPELSKEFKESKKKKECK